MRAHRHNSFIHLTLGPFEGRILRQILSLIQKEYQKKPSELDGQAAVAWYALNRLSHMSSEEKADWLQQMHEVKSSRVALIEGWIQALTVEPSAPPVELKFTFEEAQNFLAIVNDHRLLAAARNDIGEYEMDVEDAEEFNLLPRFKQSALTEVKFLGILMEYLLHFLMYEPPAEPLEGPGKT